MELLRAELENAFLHKQALAATSALNWPISVPSQSIIAHPHIFQRSPMDTYPQRVRDSILPLSVGGTLPDAFEEWYFTENVVDHEQPMETCQLCGKEDLRYHFEIKNEFTDKKLWVGSHCILQFDVPVYEDEVRLSPEESKRKLEKLTDQMRLEACIRSLERLSAAENNEILKSALEYYKRRKKLTPKFAFVVFWRLKENKIDHSPSFFKVDLKKKRYQADLEEMMTSRVHFFWPALSSSQRQMAIDMGHHPPDSN
jgi:hypothetical protein